MGEAFCDGGVNGWIAEKPFFFEAMAMVGLLLEGERSKNREAAPRVRIWSAERGSTGVLEAVGNWRVEVEGNRAELTVLRMDWKVGKVI